MDRVEEAAARGIARSGGFHDAGMFIYMGRATGNNGGQLEQCQDKYSESEQARSRNLQLAHLHPMVAKTHDLFGTIT